MVSRVCTAWWSSAAASAACGRRSGCGAPRSRSRWSTGATSTSSSRSPTRSRPERSRRRDRLSAAGDLQAPRQRARPAGGGRRLRPARRERCSCAPAAGVPAPATLPYDTLIVAGGSRYSYFGHDDWSEYAAEVKSLESALVVRSRHPRPPSRRPSSSPTPSRASSGSRSWSSAPARPASRWRARSPSSPATRPTRLPGDRPAHGAHHARRGHRPRAHELPAVAVGARRRARWRGSASRVLTGTRWSASTPDGVSIDDGTGTPDADPTPHGHLGGRRDRVRAWRRARPS